MKLARVPALILSALLAFACSEAEEATDDPADTGLSPELEDFAQRLGAAWAKKEAECEKSDLAYSTEYWTAFFRNKAKEVGPGGMLFDAAAVEPCLTAVQALGCHEVTLSIPSELPAACDEVFYGTAAIGEACNPGCARGATCLIRVASGEWCSRCVKRLVEGEACTDDAASGRCASGLSCADRKCVRPSAITQGAACDRFDPAKVCEGGSYCADSNLCEPRKTSGECFWSDECAAGYSCVEGQCRPWKSRGESCASPDECEPHAACSDPGGCEATSFFVFLKAGVGVGQSCENDPCQSSLECSEQGSICEVRPLCE